MATYDLGQGRLCLRVVYDGPEGVGKTTNVQRLSQDFAARRVAHRHRADELFGRTVSFDWEQFNTGITAGLPVQCQVLSVPGQRALRPRRRALLATADAIVFVASPDEADRASTLEAFRDLRAQLASRDPMPPVIIQINRMDTASTADAQAVAASLELIDPEREPIGTHSDGSSTEAGPTTIVVGAVATEAKGVMDTFIEAVRAAGRSLQRQIDAGGFRLPLRTELPAEVEALRDQVESLPLDDEDAAEMLLRELTRQLDAASGDADLTALLSPPSSKSKAALPWPPSTPPPLPAADAPAGHVWPPHAGRRWLETIRNVRKPNRKEKPVPALLDGETYRAALGERGEWLAVTGRLARFVDEDAARIALAEAARVHAREEDEADEALLSLLALVVGEDGAWWLWTLSRESAQAPPPSPRFRGNDPDKGGAAPPKPVSGGAGGTVS
jgi:signal recognition particle receptor subunit beta